MILLLGGTGQGKLTYALETLHLQPNAVADGAVCEWDDIRQAKAINHYHLFVRRMTERGDDPAALTQQLCDASSERIVILDEIGCGIVPMEKSERLWREQVGRCGCLLAAHADTVIRMVCGIPTAIKGELP